MKIFNKFIGLLFLFTIFLACNDNDERLTDQEKPSIDISISPQTGLNFGEELSISGQLSDNRNLKMYTITLLDQAENLLVEKTQMLLGKTFNVDEKIMIPLTAGATTSSLKLKMTLTNSNEGIEEKEFTISDVTVPKIERLFLILENNTSYEMTKNGDTFEIENTFPANAKGYFSTSPSKTSLFWGTTSGQISSFGKDPIAIGYDTEGSYKISFNPYSFNLKLGKQAVWTPLPESDCFYILGTISGHWQDGEITTERAKMKMNGFQSGEQRYYSWIPPLGDDPETGMWGAIATGDFCFKQGGKEIYIGWDGQTIIEENSYNIDKSFHNSCAGTFEIRIYFNGNQCSSIKLLGEDRTLEFEPNNVKINGIAITDKIDFANSTLSLKSGTNYIYESQISLKKGQTITSTDIDLKKINGDKDLFNGIGNTNWTLTTTDGIYIIRIDLFSGEFYACPMNGYPDVIYLNGWSWAKTSSSAAVVWNSDYELALIHVGNNVYESTLYNFGWGGSFTLGAYHPYSTEKKVSIPANLFNCEFSLPSNVGSYKISVNLKNGIKINGSTVEAINNQTFTVNFTAL